MKVDFITLLLTIGTSASVLLNNGNVNSTFNSLGNAREMMQTATARNYQLRATQQAAKNQAAIADERYKNGCLVLLYKGQLVALAQGRPVYDPITKQPLPKGTVVCDGYGTTAILEPRDFDGDGKFQPVITLEAFTGNSQLIKEALEKNRRATYQ
ncbi:hypothetical protein VF14_11600 [Nostoc linckia z18]|uniref:Uncharacterized protein n=2 Tax=Nostoc linckia TaxID=92942 RepID=A0A9Q5ZA13_NOSLI|nr:hypothetical protein [Nostoc linckia]PHK40900.1 hypothetical protein VF12_08650 [Nostoc linckia z15]PHK46443.1 hypothetical protein VF13_10885 [Nostoc linckia z16]PHJ60243.1 hypothetical protein VF02_23040 [Nostoc linckia z1]PHJ63809.1 hypothetical protein VF05_24005 [Nostoc linckia z3]PHJ70823.1 hypothetical protein VF03_21575 [Nostoc linckia z2]